MTTVTTWTGWEANALRKSLRMSVTDFAEHLGVARRTVTKWSSRGRDIQLRTEMQAALDTVLARASADVCERFEQLRAAGTSGAPVAPAAALAVPDVESVVDTGGGERDDRDQDDDVQRRQFLTDATAGGVAAIPAVAHVLDVLVPEDRVSHGEVATCRHDATRLIASMVALSSPAVAGVVSPLVEGRHRPSDPAVLAGHAQVVDILAGMYRSTDPSLMLPITSAYADSLLVLLEEHDESRSGAVFPRLVVDVHAQTGLWACHADRLPLALRHLTLACEIATSMEDNAMRVRTLGALSYLYSSAPRGGHGGKPRRALALLDGALAVSARTDPFTKGWLATWRADQHATLGNLPQARVDVDFADAALDRPDDGRTCGFFSRPTYGYGIRGHLDSVRALVHALARRGDQAEEAFTRVDSIAANMRRRIATGGHRALGYVANGDAEAACAALSRTVNLAVRERYAMGLRRAEGVRSRFAPSWSTLACVRQLDEQLTALNPTVN